MAFSMDDKKMMTDLFFQSAAAFDYKAADNATPEHARQRLKVLKHYIRAIFGKNNSNVNELLRTFLGLCGIEPEHPGSVVGGFEFALTMLKNSHQCNGRNCVKKHRASVADESGTMSSLVDQVKGKKRLPGKKKKKAKEKPKTKKGQEFKSEKNQEREYLSYMV